MEYKIEKHKKEYDIIVTGSITIVILEKDR